jgi:hypothetical protein
MPFKILDNKDADCCNEHILNTTLGQNNDAYEKYWDKDVICEVCYLMWRLRKHFEISVGYYNRWASVK